MAVFATHDAWFYMNINRRHYTSVLFNFNKGTIGRRALAEFGSANVKREDVGVAVDFEAVGLVGVGRVEPSASGQLDDAGT